MQVTDLRYLPKMKLKDGSKDAKSIFFKLSDYYKELT